MKDFRYYTPTEVVFGKNAEGKAGEVAAKYKISRNYVSQIKIRIDKRIVAVGQALVSGDGESS